MKPILVHCHIYYPQMWAELKECIHNIEPHPFKLFVTMVEKHTDIWEDILSDFPNAHVEIVENRGYDVGPFVHIINQVNLDNYSYVVKLHTKRDIPSKTDRLNDLSVYGSVWRDKLLSPFKSKEIFKQYLQAFEKDPKIGMQAHYTLLIQNKRDEDIASLTYLKRYYSQKINYLFVAGTMFIAKANIFKFIQELNLSLADFEVPQKNCGELAHALERMIGYITYKVGYICCDGRVSKNIQKEFQRQLPKLSPPNFFLRFLFQSKISRNGKKIIKICKIPIFVRKVK